MHWNIRSDILWLCDSHVRWLWYSCRAFRYGSSIRPHSRGNGIHHRRYLRMPHQSSNHPWSCSFWQDVMERRCRLLARTADRRLAQLSLEPILQDSAQMALLEQAVPAELSWLKLSGRSSSSLLCLAPQTRRLALAISQAWQ